MGTICPCCGDVRPPTALLRRRPMIWRNAWEPEDAAPTRRHPLCEPCLSWLAGVLSEVGTQESGGRAPLFGVPTTGGRALLFEDQCQVCHVLPGGRGTMVDCVTFGANHSSWAAFFACPSCDAWIASLAEDGRSARGDASRSIDGAYGQWPHANLRDLRVTLQVVDRGAANTIHESCATMGVGVSDPRHADGAVLIIEATPGGSILRDVREAVSAGRAVIVLAHLGSQPALTEALTAGAVAWPTIPITPQQVSAALSGLVRRGPRKQWDDDTCLPRALLEGSARPAIAFAPVPGVRAFEIAWLLKRFARGYDDVVLADGQVVLLPKVPIERLEEVQARLDSRSPAVAHRCLSSPPIVSVGASTYQGESLECFPE